MFPGFSVCSVLRVQLLGPHVAGKFNSFCKLRIYHSDRQLSHLLATCQTNHKILIQTTNPSHKPSIPKPLKFGKNRVYPIWYIPHHHVSFLEITIFYRFYWYIPNLPQKSEQASPENAQRWRRDRPQPVERPVTGRDRLLHCIPRIVSA